MNVKRSKAFFKIRKHLSFALSHPPPSLQVFLFCCSAPKSRRLCLHTLSQEGDRAGNGEVEEDTELPSGDGQLCIKPRFEPTLFHFLWVESGAGDIVSLSLDVYIYKMAVSTTSILQDCYKD